MLVLKMWDQQEGDYFFLSTKSPTGKWKDHPIKRGRWSKVKRLIRENPDHDIYMCPHGFTKPIRQKIYSVDPNLMYADLDESDPRKIPIKPTIAIESSPGRYVGYWVTDEPATEELNRRLAYMIKADTSGWDRTQVLRVPNTRNYKYEDEPRVKILWKDGPTYEIKKLEKIIPQMDQSVVTDEQLSKDSARIYNKYQKRLHPFARRELMNPRPKHGARSEVLWKLQNYCLEAGMSQDEAFSILWSSGWNKFKDRRDGPDRLMREINKATERRFTGGKVPDRPEDKEEKKRAFLVKPISEVETKNIDWVIPGFLARKELSILEGDPSNGKSYLITSIAGAVVDGKRMPFFGKYPIVKGNVIVFDTENTQDTVMKGRLIDNGVKNLHRFFQEESPFSIDDEEWDEIVERVIELNPQLIVFDTINTYLGSVDTYRASETQQAMGFFKELARRCNCPVLLVRHLTKGSKDKALYRGQGSIAFTGAARIVATVSKLPDDDDVRVVSCTKNNLTKYFKSFTYSIESLPDKNGRGNRSRLVWGDQVDLSSDQIISAVTNGQNKDKEVAAEKLTELLSEGRVEEDKVYRRMEKRSLSKSAVDRAATHLGVIKTYHRGVTWWSLK